MLILSQYLHIYLLNEISNSPMIALFPSSCPTMILHFESPNPDLFFSMYLSPSVTLYQLHISFCFLSPSLNMWVPWQQGWMTCQMSQEKLVAVTATKAQCPDSQTYNISPGESHFSFSSHSQLWLHIGITFRALKNYYPWVYPPE